jgi:hypothetical protein
MPCSRSLLGREVFQSTTTLRQLHHLLGCGEGERSRQGGFQVCLKELTVPAIPEHVIHVDIAEWLTSLSTFRAQPFSLVPDFGFERVLTFPANLPGQPLPSRRSRSPLIGENNVEALDYDGNAVFPTCLPRRARKSLKMLLNKGRGTRETRNQSDFDAPHSKPGSAGARGEDCRKRCGSQHSPGRGRVCHEVNL